MKDLGDSLDRQSMVTLALRAQRHDLELEVHRTFVYFVPSRPSPVRRVREDAETQPLPRFGRRGG